MYTICLCDLSPIGECPFAVVDCSRCQSVVTYDPTDTIVVEPEPTTPQNFEDFTLD